MGNRGHVSQFNLLGERKRVNRSLGTAGELFVLNFEVCKGLINLGQREACEKSRAHIANAGWNRRLDISLV